MVIDAAYGAECQVAYADSTREDPEDAICDLRNREGTVRARNFEKEKNRPFSLDEACRHLQALSPEGKARTTEYIWRAPSLVVTPLRQRLQQEPWFAAAKP